MADFKKHKDYTKVRISVPTSVERHRLSIASFKTGLFFFYPLALGFLFLQSYTFEVEGEKVVHKETAISLGITK